MATVGPVRMLSIRTSQSILLPGTQQLDLAAVMSTLLNTAAAMPCKRLGRAPDRAREKSAGRSAPRAGAQQRGRGAIGLDELDLGGQAQIGDRRQVVQLEVAAARFSSAS